MRRVGWGEWTMVSLERGRAALALGGALALAACGGSGGGGGGLAASGGPHWNMADACRTLSRPDVEAAAGVKVKSAENRADAASGATVATCTYIFADDGVMTMMTRVTDDPVTDAQVQEMRTAGGMMPAGDVVPGLGMTAFYSDKTRQLQLFADRKHYAGLVYGPALTLPGTPPAPGPDPRTLVTTLAKKLL